LCFSAESSFTGFLSFFECRLGFVSNVTFVLITKGWHSGGEKLSEVNTKLI